MPSESATFTPSSILFRPRRDSEAELADRTIRASGSWWRRRVPPPGPSGLLRSLCIAI